MSSPTWKGTTAALIEQPDSPSYNLGREVTQTRVYKGLHTLCVSSALPYGTLGSGDQAGYMVQSSVVTKEGFNIGKLVIVWSANADTSGQSLPPDEVSVDPVENNPALEKHPNYASLSDAQIKIVGDCLNGSTGSEGSLTTLAAELLAKLRRGQTNFYQAGLRYTWTQYYWSVSGSMNLGSYIETPTGPLSALFPGGLSWIREADGLSWNGQHYKWTFTWVAGPGGHFDPDIY